MRLLLGEYNKNKSPRPSGGEGQGEGVNAKSSMLKIILNHLQTN
jgi:hypothetical protein